ncbi:MAG: alpha/beta hydrolase [Actinomycetes bacterium]
MRGRRWPWAAAAVVVVLVAVAVGVLLRGGPTPSGTSSQLPPLAEPTLRPGDPSTDPAYSTYYRQHPRWMSCRQHAKCTRVTVPVDWDDPAAGSIELAVARLPATKPGERIGSLVLNPGGPGGSGADYVGDYGEYVTTPDVRARYDIVGFDPRGVGQSHPVDCLSDRAMDRYLAFDADPDTPGGLQAMRQEADRFAGGCLASAGSLLGHVDTISAAKDMDVLRAVLGDKRLNYLGKSYGTLLGATYAGEYPGRVGRMVLDGALDPASSHDDVVLGQAVGMQQALRAYVADCQAGEQKQQCPLPGDVAAGEKRVRQLLDDADRSPLRTSDPARPVTASLALNGVIQPLYDDRSWPELTAALSSAFSGDGTKLLALADQYAQRGPDGSYDGNLLEVFNAVTCLDYPMNDDPAAMHALEQRLVAASPTFGSYLAYGEVLCGEWPVTPVRTPAPIRADGAPPILVVGTTGDPATPYRWAQALARELKSGRLLTWDGEGHTAYLRGSQCVDGAVDRYLLDGELPGEGAACSR